MVLDSQNNLTDRMKDSRASAVIGESVFEFAGTVTQIDSVPRILGSGIVNIFTNLKSVFSNKKKIIIVSVVALCWILLMLLPVFGVNPKFVDLLSKITFARGGMSGDIKLIIGGILGKGMVAGFIAFLFSGRLKNVGAGLKKVFSSVHFQSLSVLGALLFGTGVSLITYNFMVGYADLSHGIVGISGFVLTLNALGGGNGFIRRMVSSLTAKRMQKQRIENTDMLNSMLWGLSMGFVLSVILSAIPYAYTPYITGCASFVAALVLMILGKKSKKEVQQ